MWAFVERIPLIVLIIGVSAGAMFLPAAHASLTDQHEVARAFFYSSILFLMLFSMLCVVTNSKSHSSEARTYLVTLVATYVAIPLVLAVPFYEAVGDTSFLNAYIEMVSCLTTTGATLYPAERLDGSVHLWRAVVGWFGGFYLWVMAFAILAPMRLGGFEIISREGRIGQFVTGQTPIARVASAQERVSRFVLQLLPIYVSLTFLLWALLYILGDPPLVAVSHAMSVLSTSGISPIGGPNNANSGVAGEIFIAVFFVFALSRLTFARDERGEGWTSVRNDPELKLGLLIVLALTLLMTLRHWFGAIEVSEEEDIAAFLRAFWGSAFTTISFLSTTGFESAEWATARGWSGLEAPGLILLGLSILGGGVATTAGGVKLLRIFALYKHGLREMERLVHPSSVAGAGGIARYVRRQGATVAWIFFMLFGLSIAGFMALLSVAGLDFEESMVLAISGLTTTGPLVTSVATSPIEIEELGSFAKLVYSAAMIVGRLETLALIALLNPDFWRE